MAIAFFPTPGMVLMCDYGSGGFQPPEMVKYRRVVVVSPRFQAGDLSARVALVVPISTTPPNNILPIHVRIESGAYPFFHETDPVWVKADMLSHVGFQRLDRLKIEGRFADSRKTILRGEDFKRVQVAILHALGMGHLAAIGGAK